MAQIKLVLLQGIRKALNRYALDEDIIEVCLNGMAKGTITQYEYHIRELTTYCQSKNIDDAYNISLNTGLGYLKQLFDNGKSYSTINTARSAISQFISITDAKHIKFGEHAIVKRFMMGIYRKRPPLPKYNTTWDVKPLLDYLRTVSNNSASFKDLTIKLVCLLALTTGQRVQTLASLDLDQMFHDSDKISFRITEVLKTSKPGRPQVTINVNAYPNEAQLCPLTCLKAYIEVSKSLRSESKLFIGLVKPHKVVGSQTISRWICLGLQKAKIDDKFTSHSVRHASTSKAANNIPITDILRTVGWAKESTFATFYRRELQDSGGTFTNSVLR